MMKGKGKIKNKKVGRTQISNVKTQNPNEIKIAPNSKV